MKVKALRSFYGESGHVRRHQVIEVSDYRAKQLLTRGLVSEVQAGKPSEEEPKKGSEKEPEKGAEKASQAPGAKKSADAGESK